MIRRRALYVMDKIHNLGKVAIDSLQRTYHLPHTYLLIYSYMITHFTVHDEIP